MITPFTEIKVPTLNSETVSHYLSNLVSMHDHTHTSTGRADRINVKHSRRYTRVRGVVKAIATMAKLARWARVVSICSSCRACCAFVLILLEHARFSRVSASSRACLLILDHVFCFSTMSSSSRPCHLLRFERKARRSSRCASIVLRSCGFWFYFFFKFLLVELCLLFIEAIKDKRAT